jgi:hypothetical protein
VDHISLRSNFVVCNMKVIGEASGDTIEVQSVALAEQIPV